MPGSNKKKRQQNAGGATGDEPEVMGVDRTGGIDPAMKAFLISIKTDINASTNAAVEKIDKGYRTMKKQYGN